MESLIVILFVIITMALGVLIGVNGFALGGFSLFVFAVAIFYTYRPILKPVFIAVKKLFKKW